MRKWLAPASLMVRAARELGQRMGGDVTPKPGLTEVISFLNWRSFEDWGRGLMDPSCDWSINLAIIMLTN
jgi:hypothetical protein